MRPFQRPDLSHFLVVLAAVNAKVITMYQRTAHSQSDANASILLVSIQRWSRTSAQKAVHVKNL